MLNPKISRYLHHALVAILYLILLTPVLVSSKYLFPFITTKTMYFRILVEVAFLVYVTLAMLAPVFRPKMTKLSWAVVIFGVVIFITGTTGVNFYKTFWGTIERGEGFLTIFHLIIYFLILTWTFKTFKEWLNFLTAVVAVSFLVDGYALLQRLKVKEFLGIRIIHSGEGRLSATIGNAAFLGAYTLANFFLSLVLFLKRKKIGWKAFFLLSLLLNLYILYQTQTRGAAIAWLVVIILLAFLYLFKSPSWVKRKIAGAVLLIIILASLMVGLNKDSRLVQSSPMLRRLVTISRQDITTESRLLAADTSWKGWRDRFLLGYGWENYNIAFNKYFHTEIFKDVGSQLWFDRAHNTIFDVAVATGLFGLLVYLSIFGLAFYYLFKHLKNDFDFSAVLMALLLAHFLQNIFVFDVLASYIILFTVLAAVVFIRLEKKLSVVESTEKGEFNIFVFSGAALVILLAVYVFNLKPLKANEIAIQALISANMGKENQAVDFFQEAINMHTYQTMEIRQKFADNIVLYNTTRNGLSNAEVYKNFEIAIRAIKDNIHEHPLDVQNYLYLMTILNKAGAYNPQYYEEVIEWGEQALKLSPTRPQIYFEMGQARINQKHYDQGIEYFKKAIELNPQTLESHWNLLAAYIIAGRNEEAEREYQWMAEQGYDFDNLRNLERLYNIYLVAGRKDKLVEILEKTVKIKPSGSNYAKLAAAYQQFGEIGKAKAAVQKAVELDPSLKGEAEKFLQILEENK